MERKIIVVKKENREVGQFVGGRDQKLIASKYLSILRDGCGWHDVVHSKHQKFVFVTIVKHEQWVIEAIRPITAIEWWELLPDKSEDWMISDSLKTPEFVEYMKEKHSDVEMDLPLVMTGEQFKEYYPGVYVRLFVEDKNHNGHKWEKGLNKCENFDPSIKCGNGLYFVHERHRDLWLQYNKKVMYWWSYVIIPDYTTVAVIEDPCDENNIKFNAKDLEIVEFIKL